MRASDPVQAGASRTALNASEKHPVRRHEEPNMTINKTIAAGLVALAALAAAPANAAGLSLSFGDGAVRATVNEAGERHHDRGWDRGRWHDDWRRTLSPREVRRILRDRGYREIRYLDRRGAIYQVHAVDYRHKHVGLVVSARNGAILTAYRLR
jgi:hypothetical protein